MATPTSVSRRTAPIVGGGALAGLTFVLARVDPAAPDSPFPACQFRAATGLWCPGCGLTRGAHQLLRGDLVGAIDSNMFVPAVSIAVMVGWWWWLRTAWGRPVSSRTRRSAERVGLATVVAAATYGVLRNLPGEAFAVLAP